MSCRHRILSRSCILFRVQGMSFLLSKSVHIVQLFGFGVLSTLLLYFVYFILLLLHMCSYLCHYYYVFTFCLLFIIYIYVYYILV